MLKPIKIIIIVIFFYSPLILAQQESTEIDSIRIIQIKELYEGEAVIFPASYSRAPKNSAIHTIGRYTPTISDIKLAEKFVIQNIFSENDGDSIIIKDYLDKLKNNYFRQYFGYLDSDSNKIILIHFMNFKNSPPSLYQDWKKDFVLTIVDDINSKDGSGYNSRFVWINISKMFRYEKNFQLNWN